MMDKLARNAMLARQKGMSYGQWMALQPVVQVEKTIPEGWRACERCGKPFDGKNKTRRFCDVICQREAYFEKKKKGKEE